MGLYLMCRKCQPSSNCLRVEAWSKRIGFAQESSCISRIPASCPLLTLFSTRLDNSLLGQSDMDRVISATFGEPLGRQPLRSGEDKTDEDVGK
jgi:hypothetical protein